ncbi:MAG: UvrD-helicase domain-containing protein [Chromatocurvus sp.]
MPGLNPQQREAVRYIDGPLLVLAGAGSGKTSVITEKIVYLVRQCGQRPERIAAVTFTNKAAREMRQRIGNLLSREAAEKLTISTFHQLGLNIIRHEQTQLSLRRGFSIFDNQDTLTLLQELLRQQSRVAADQAGAVAQRISAWKSTCTDSKDALHEASGSAEILAARTYERYAEALRAFNAVDFDDLLMLPARLLENCRDPRQRWQERIHYLLVDEYQDTNEAQYRLVRQLTGLRAALTVVGDDDQSIYAWRGARPENLAQLQTDFPALRVIKLEQNYRSTGRILQAANQLIANNGHLFEKALWSGLGPGEQLQVIECADEDAEASQVVAGILGHQLRRGTRLGAYAILYRGNHQSKLIELALQQRQVPYQISGGTSFFARNEIKDVMAYLRVLINRDDDNAFLRIANVPRRGLGTATLQALGRLASQRHCSLTQACRDISDDLINPASLRQLQALLGYLEQARRQNDSGSIDSVHQLLRDIRYEDWLHKNSSSEEVAQRRMGNVRFLLDSLSRLIQREQCNLADAIAQLVLRDLLEQQEEEKNSESCVQLLTLHAAKGLEFPHVHIVGMEENLLPHRNSIDSGNIEEERRLAYVGLTRAQETLSMTWARKRRQFGERLDCKPSRFLGELPREDIIWFGGTENDAEKNNERGAETLSSLRTLLD